MENRKGSFNYKDLIVWQKAFALCISIYQITGFFPRSELYGLVSQLRRAAVSIPSNIAEGRSRVHAREYINFLSISLGSASELETQLMIAKELKYINEDRSQLISQNVIEVIKMIRGLLSSLRG
jgi:four helix bundle protein